MDANLSVVLYLFLFPCLSNNPRGQGCSLFVHMPYCQDVQLQKFVCLLEKFVCLLRNRHVILSPPWAVQQS